MKQSEIFYGWFVVIACFFVTMSLGETMWSFGVFFKPLENEFGWSRRLISSGYTAFLLGYSLSAVIAGRLTDRYTPRSILLACGVLAGLGMSLCSRVQSVNEFRLFLFVSGLGAGSTWTVPIATVQLIIRPGLCRGVFSEGAIIFLLRLASGNKPRITEPNSPIGSSSSEPLSYASACCPA